MTMSSRPSMTGAGENRMPPKVVGLGAPISVWIYFDVSETRALAAAIGDELTRYGDRREWVDQTNELGRMLADIEQTRARRAAGRFDVVWPTVLAHAVVRGAVGHARRLLDGAPPGEVATARLALTAAERTRTDFDLVDGGGLEAVWL